MVQLAQALIFQIALPELAPWRMYPGCRVFMGPVPPPLWIRDVDFVAADNIKHVSGCQDSQKPDQGFSEVAKRIDKIDSFAGKL